MDDYSWLLHGGGDDMRSSCVAEQCHKYHQLDQIYKLLNVPENASLPSSSSSSFRSFSGNCDDSSSLILNAASDNSSCHRHHQNVSGSILDLDMTTLDPMCDQQTPSTATASAFRPYNRLLVARKNPKPGACGQRVIKTAMSSLEKIHMARLAQMRTAAQASPSTPAACDLNQLRVLTERKRREKINDSFKALKSLLPPGLKKDKGSVLIRARDYVNTLKCRVAELEEKNKMLIESQLSWEERIEIEISRTEVEGTLEFQLKIVLPSGCNVMDAAAGILQCLNERDVNLLAMNTDTSCSTGLSEANSFSRSTIILQVQSNSCDEQILRESVAKAVKDVM